MSAVNRELKDWVEEVIAIAQPSNVQWCTGSDKEYDEMVESMVESGDLIALNQESHPGCYLHRSDPNDVARTEHLTFICMDKKEDAGPNNNWMSPEEGHARFNKLLTGSMKGRTLYVIPYCMGPIDSPFARFGVEITDSPYVVANMKIMTRMGEAALAKINTGTPFVKGIHSRGDLSIENRMILHFPEESVIKSIGSGYGGNALLGKKCHALRIASYQAKREGWLAEHMLIVGVENPEGEVHYIAAAFPSACGKTNLAMLIPPEEYKGWKVWTVGDDIAWLHLGEDGRMYAVNPEAGFFGVAPGTSNSTNPNALSMLQHDAIFTNIAVTEDQKPYWEGLSGCKAHLDWQGLPYEGKGAAAHPNSRFTVSSKQCPSYSQHAESPQGVPISAVVFGGRRPNLVPLVYEAKSWAHGVLVGASVSSETTAAASGQVGVLRRDPMAMKPFCGYNFADYWDHWLGFEQKSDKLPKVFHVNWFRQTSNGKYLWPGFGNNIRVLDWILRRVENKVGAEETPIGFIPKTGEVDTKGLNIDREVMAELCRFDREGWKKELQGVGEYLDSYGDRLPKKIKDEYCSIYKSL